TARQRQTGLLPAWEFAGPNSPKLAATPGRDWLQWKLGAVRKQPREASRPSQLPWTRKKETRPASLATTNPGHREKLREISQTAWCAGAECIRREQKSQSLRPLGSQRRA